MIEYSRKKIIPFFFLVFIYFFSLYSQESTKVDSLLTELKNSDEDTNRVNILNSLAVELRRKTPDDATKYAKDALLLSQDLNFIEGLGDSYLSIGRIHHVQFKLTEARSNYMKAFSIYKEIGTYEEVADVSNKIGITYGIQGDYEKALEFFNKSLEANKELDAKSRMADCLNNMGNVYKYLGNYSESFKTYNQALKIYEELHDTADIAMCYNHFGILYDYQGDYRQALDYYFLSLRMREIVGDKAEIAASYANIGIVYYYLGEYEQALEYQFKNLELSRETGQKRGAGLAYTNLGTIYEKLEKYDLAHENYLEAVEILNEIGDKQGITDAYFNIGNVYQKQKKYDMALEYQKKSLGIGEDIKYKHGIANSCYSIGSVYSDMKKTGQAISYLERSLSIGEELGMPEIIRATSEILSNIYQQQNNFRKAYDFHVLYKQMDDSLNDAENVKKITQLEMQYDFDKKQRQAELEQEQERIRHEAEIKQQKLVRNFFIAGFMLLLMFVFMVYRWYTNKKKSDAEKEVLLKEIHHRVKNNLQTISSLLNLQTYSLKDEKVKDAVLEGQSRVKSMALIHQTLYQTERLSRIDFQNYIKQLVSFLSDSFKSAGKTITAKVITNDINLDIDTAIPLGLIVNELVSNVYKYAFPKKAKGEIVIELKRSDKEEYQLEVADNGIGLPENLDPEKVDSLGLKLVNILTRQIKGQLKYEVNNGTKFTISFKEVIKKT
jgi:two-component sensor histidine kinase